MEREKITVGIADDHKTFRQALCAVLSEFDCISVLFDVENGADLLSSLQVYRPDVILLDIKMPVLNGIKTLEVVSERYPEIRVLILSGVIEEPYILKCLEFGINGYLTKNMDINEIVNAIRKAYRNDVYVTNLLKDNYFKKYISHFKKKATDVCPGLSLEEIEIVELLKQEKTIEEISRIMCQSKRSIELKRTRLKEKLKVSTTGGILLYCHKIGLIE